MLELHAASQLAVSGRQPQPSAPRREGLVESTNLQRACPAGLRFLSMVCGAYALYIAAYLFLLGMGLLSQQWFLGVHKDIFAAAAKAKQSCLFRPPGSLL